MERKESVKDTKLVFPWDDSSFNGGKETLNYIYGELRKCGYSVGKYKQEPDKDVVLMVEQMFGMFIAENKWIYILCNNYEFMQALAQIMAITYALTTENSCLNVTTQSLVSMFSGRGPTDAYDVDRVGDNIIYVARSGLLVWEGIHEIVRYANQNRGIDEMMRKRASLKSGSTVCMALYSGAWKEKTLEEIEKSLEPNIGLTASKIICERCELVHIARSVPEKKFFNVGV